MYRFLSSIFMLKKIDKLKSSLSLSVLFINEILVMVVIYSLFENIYMN